MQDTKLDQLNKARVKGYSKYCQGRAHAKLLNQHVFKPYFGDAYWFCIASLGFDTTVLWHCPALPCFLCDSLA